MALNLNIAFNSVNLILDDIQYIFTLNFYSVMIYTNLSRIELFVNTERRLLIHTPVRCHVTRVFTVL